MPPRYDVRNRVRRFRRMHELTQEELAERVGVTRQTILSIEGGRYNPSVGLALRIAAVFGEPLESLFQLESEDTDDD